ncbi:hypothetical protein B0H66DRAFT_537942 [Apodospora peruviana]|uniref:Uncharacterized protein n=1 Tax=Apodospora peruviana TaxID=516989 RepID=A0AAE0HTX5_9PEZI|nr:hypothetical protein B0H66DRAFT_537942 [Apodospora peruviana]
MELVTATPPEAPTSSRGVSFRMDLCDPNRVRKTPLLTCEDVPSRQQPKRSCNSASAWRPPGQSTAVPAGKGAGSTHPENTSNTGHHPSNTTPAGVISTPSGQQTTPQQGRQVLQARFIFLVSKFGRVELDELSSLHLDTVQFAQELYSAYATHKGFWRYWFSRTSSHIVISPSNTDDDNLSQDPVDRIPQRFWNFNKHLNARENFWGIYVRERRSAIMTMLYILLGLAPFIGFWVLYILGIIQANVHNATTPLAISITALGLFLGSIIKL